MDAERLKQIRERSEKATPGKWQQYGLIGSGALGSVQVQVGNIGRTTHPNWKDVLPNHENARFIAHARTDVPDLLKELELANARIKTLEAAIHRHNEAQAGNGDADDCELWAVLRRPSGGHGQATVPYRDHVLGLTWGKCVYCGESNHRIQSHPDMKCRPSEQPSA